MNTFNVQFKRVLSFIFIRWWQGTNNLILINKGIKCISIILNTQWASLSGWLLWITCKRSQGWHLCDVLHVVSLTRCFYQLSCDSFSYLLCFRIMTKGLRVLWTKWKIATGDRRVAVVWITSKSLWHENLMKQYHMQHNNSSKHCIMTQWAIWRVSVII